MSKFSNDHACYHTYTQDFETELMLLSCIDKTDDLHKIDKHAVIDQLKAHLTKTDMSVEKLMQMALDCAEILTNSQIGFFHFVEPNQQEVALQVWSTNTLVTFCFAEGKGLHYPIANAGVWTDCIHQRRPVVHNDYATLPHKKGLPEGHAELLRELTVPVFLDATIVAVVGVGNKRVDYDDGDIKTVQDIGAIAYELIQQKRTKQQHEFTTYHDLLTGLPNRIMLLNRLNQAITDADEANTIIAIAYLNIDDFSAINATYGRTFGDQVLLNLTQRLKQIINPSDTLACLGGDEFALLVPNLTQTNEGEALLRKFLKIIEQPLAIAEHEIQLSAGIGFTLYPLDKVGAELLLRHADQALYQAKRENSNGICLYDVTHTKRRHLYQKTITELRQALATDKLVLYYQPKVNFTTGKMVGVEACVRWRHPQRGLLDASKFMDAIEGTTEAMHMDAWAIRQALAQIAAWEQDVPATISVKIHHNNLCNPWLLDTIRVQAGLWPKTLMHRLEIEILGFAMAKNFEELAKVMADCTELGIRFTLNDFGDDCTQLNHFWHLPITGIKLDQAFVQGALENISHFKYIEDVICLAQDFELHISAEGVDRADLAALLIDLGCQIGQGAGIAQPMPVELLLDWQHTWRVDPRCRELSQLDPTSHLDTLIQLAIRTVQRWSTEVTYFVASAGVGPRPILCADQCTITNWYNGLGRFRYGNRPTFPFLTAHHNALHLFAAKLVELVDGGFQDHANTELDRFYSQRDEFIDMLQRLGTVNT